MPSAPHRGRGDAGETLVEILATITILGIAAVAIITGIGTALRLSGEQRGQANADVALVAAAEAVKTYAPSGSPTCATLTLGTYQPAITALTKLPPGWTTSNLTITSATCPTVNGVSTLPKIGITATTPNGKNSESVDVVRRSVT